MRVVGDNNGKNWFLCVFTAINIQENCYWLGSYQRVMNFFNFYYNGGNWVKNEEVF